MVGLKTVVWNFLKDDSGIEGMPMRLAVAVILFSAILGLSAKVLFDFTYDAKEDKLIGELDMIEKRAAVMFTQGGARDIDNPNDSTWTKEYVHVKIPDNTAFAVFGAMPASNGEPPQNRDINTDNVYYYVLDNGKVKAKSSIARFSANDTDLNMPAVLYPGEYDLAIELVKKNNGTYIMIEAGHD